MKTSTPVEFKCSTGTKYKVAKVILEGKEYPVTIKAELGGNKYHYVTDYIATSYDQDKLHYNKIILENGAAIDINQDIGCIDCMVIQAEPTFSITSFTEDTKERVVRFGYKLVDDDSKLADMPTFTLKDSQGTVLQTIKTEPGQDMVEFKIPDPPTSVYNLLVTAPKYEVMGFDYTNTWVAYNDSHQSSVTTSILSSEIKNKYPKKGETIDVIYNISSTKVVVIDKEDHSNQDKAVSISKMIINGEEYDVEAVSEDDEIVKEKYSDISCLLVHEAQFLEERQVDQLLMIAAKLNIAVICYGLRCDFKMDGFRASPRLLSIADKLEEIKTICKCGHKATINVRKVNGEYVFDGKQVAIDGEDDVTYESMCPECYFKLKEKSKTFVKKLS